MTRRFNDALQGERCQAVVTLRDGSTADCGRKSVTGGLCTQHAKIAAPLNVVTPMLRRPVAVGGGEYQIVELCRVESSARPTEYSVQVIRDHEQTMRWMHRTMIGAELNFNLCVQQLSSL